MAIEALLKFFNVLRAPLAFCPMLAWDMPYILPNTVTYSMSNQPEYLLLLPYFWRTAMKTLSIEDLSHAIELRREAMEHVRGGRINLRKFGPTPTHSSSDGSGAGYFLPELEMDTGGPVYLSL